VHLITQRYGAQEKENLFRNIGVETNYVEKDERLVVWVLRLGLVFFLFGRHVYL
jgi:hypothetical protein